MLTNPIFKSVKNVNYYLIFWSVLAILFIQLIYLSTDIGLTASIADGLVFTFLLALFGIPLWYPARYIPIEKNSALKILLSHGIGALITTTLWILAGYFLMVSVIGIKDDYPAFLYSTLAWRIFIGILFYSLFISFYYMIVYYLGFHEREIKEAELKSLVTEAELRSLKFQINPHFIFNSLNSMSALTEIDPPRAKQMIIKLADFLRFILKTNELEKNKLSDELKNISLYLDIEKVRFEDKFEYVEEVKKGCGEIEIPSMILQPLFENSIKHAVYETLDKVVLKLSCETTDEYLKIIVENNYDETDIIKKGAGVGLKNINERLKLIYRQDNLLNINSKNGIFKVTLFIPIEDEKTS